MLHRVPWLFALLVWLPLAATAAETPFGRYHALVIGNNAYQSLPKLQTAVADAEAVAQLLETKYNFQVRLLRDATRTDILRALNEYRAELTPDDNLLIYYAGHGYIDRQTDTGFWQPVDAEDDDDLNWVSNADLTRRLNAMTAKHVMVIADSCYSGTLVRSSTGDIPTGQERDTWLKRLNQQRSRTAIVSGGIEPVADAGRDGHSVFAAAFIDALTDNREYIEGSSLFRKISRPVVVNAEQTPQYSDIRNAGHEGGEFIFVPAGVETQIAAVTTQPTTTGQTRGGGSPEVVFWQSIQESGEAADFEAYLAKYPDGAFAPLAKTRLAALQADAAKGEIAGSWISEPIKHRYEKGYLYQFVFDFRVIGDKLLGTLTWKTAPGSKRDYRDSKRAISEGSVDGNVITFAEPFEVLMGGSGREKHKRIFTGEVKGDSIAMFLQDTLGNPPEEFAVTRVKP
ncbi:MAG: caspase family protein [Alphaproteobacteria bacterium]